MLYLILLCKSLNIKTIKYKKLCGCISREHFEWMGTSHQKRVALMCCGVGPCACECVLCTTVGSSKLAQLSNLLKKLRFCRFVNQCHCLRCKGISLHFNPFWGRHKKWNFFVALKCVWSPFPQLLPRHRFGTSIAAKCFAGKVFGQNLLHTRQQCTFVWSQCWWQRFGNFCHFPSTCCTINDLEINPLHKQLHGLGRY